MVDWRASSLQIIVALIGSSLIVTALTSLSSYFSKPSLDISVQASNTSLLNGITYRIFLVNNGYSTAKDVRLTMTFPNATVINATMIYQNENFSLAETTDSVVASSPRLSTGVKIGIETNITGIVQEADNIALLDFDTDYHNNYYFHRDPFSITVTYDEGGNTYHPPLQFGSTRLIYLYYNTDALKFFIPVVFGILLIGIAYRHKKKSASKFVSNVLKDIKTAENRLIEPDSKAIVPYKNYDYNFENELQPFDNYDHYKLIDEFYKGLRERESIILNPNLSNLDDVLKEQNQKCFNQARSAHTSIDWKKFHKLDLILLIPSIFLGSYFITLICEGLPIAAAFQIANYFNAGKELAEVQTTFLGLYTLSIPFILRTIGTFFIMRFIMKTVQGPFISGYEFPWLTRKGTFFILSFLMMAFPSFIVVYAIDTYALHFTDYTEYQLQKQILFDYSTTIVVGLDIIRMLILTLIVSHFPRVRSKHRIVELQ